MRFNAALFSLHQIVHGVVGLVENGMSFIVNMIPYYSVFKLAAFIWLYHSSTRGARRRAQGCRRRQNLPGERGLVWAKQARQ